MKFPIEKKLRLGCFKTGLGKNSFFGLRGAKTRFFRLGGIKSTLLLPVEIELLRSGVNRRREYGVYCTCVASIVGSSHVRFSWAISQCFSGIF